MFGFLRHCRNDSTYQRAYRRCCQFQHIEYGVPSLAFLSYESVFLYQLGIDHGLVDSEQLVETQPIANRRCCRLQASRRMLNDADAWLARFAASFGVLLGKVKIEDDIRDSGSMAARLAARALRKKHNKAMNYFQSLDGRFSRKIDELIGHHHDLERSADRHSIQDYSKPTGNAFGYLFQLLSKAAAKHGVQSTRFNSIAKPVGQLVGQSIIAFDCSVDFERDKQRNEYNPLCNEDEVKDSLAFCTSRLAAASSLIATESGRMETASALPTQRILNGRINALHRRFRFLGECLGQPALMAAGDLPPSSMGEEDKKRNWFLNCCDSWCLNCNYSSEPTSGCCSGDTGDAAGGCCEGADCCSGCDCG